MSVAELEKIRSFTLLGASGSGKTALAEALLYRAGVLHHLGQADTRILDTDPEEQKRKSSVVAKVQSLAWDKHRIHFADTPGLPDFFGEALAPLLALDTAVIVIDATQGVDVATQQEFKRAVQYKKPILFFINKMNKERANFEGTLESIRNNLSKHAQPVALPIGAGENFRGVMDLIDTRAFVYQGSEAKEVPIPEEEKERFEQAQRHLIEEVAETSEELFEKLASGQPLKKDDILPQLIKDIEEEEIIPVLVGNADPPVGTALLLDTLTHLILPPHKHREPVATDGSKQKIPLKVHPFEPAVAQVFKVISDPGVGDLFFMRVLTGTLKPGMDLTNATHSSKERIGHLLTFEAKERKEVNEAIAGEVVAVAKLKQTHVGDTLCDGSRFAQMDPIPFPHPVFAVTLLPKTRKDQDKLGPALGKLHLTDPTLHFEIDPEFNETILSGMGEVHLEVAANRLREKYGVDLTLGQPHVPYRETITAKVKAQGKYKKQTGGHGQYGDVWIWAEPRPRGTGFEFVDDIKGGTIPGKYIPSVERGIIDSMKRGQLAGYPVVDVKVSLFDGSFHSVDSSDLAFQIAGSLAIKKCEEEGRPILLEPIMKITVTTPADYVGTITNDLTSRRAKITGMNQEGEIHELTAEVPMAEIFKYATDLRSMTHGAGSYRAELARYEALPGHLTAKVIEETKSLRGKK